MANQTLEVRPIPEPGLAIFPNNLSTTQIDLVMRIKRLTGSWTIDFADGRPFLKVESPTFTMSSRKHIIDANTGEKLCDLRSRKAIQNKSYLAQAPNSSSPLIEIFNTNRNNNFWLDGGKYQSRVKFANAAAGNTPEELYLQGDSYKDLENPLTWNGICCGVIDEKYKSSKNEYRLKVAPGLDPFLLAILTIALDTKETEDEGDRAGRVSVAMGSGPIGLYPS
jgi:hypothetical protein